MSVKGTVDTADAILTFAVKAVVIIALSVAAFRTNLVSAVADKLGITGFEIWGIKITRTITTLDQHSNDLAAEVSALQQKLVANDQLLRAAASQPAFSHPKQAQALQDLLKSNEVAIKAAAISANQSAKIATATAPEVASAQVKSASVDSTWGVVFGADTDVAAERNEALLAKKAGFPSVKIYKRGSWYRSVIEYSERTSAASNLDRIRAVSQYAAGAYIVNLTTWCPSKILANDDIVNCQSAQ